MARILSPSRYAVKQAAKAMVFARRAIVGCQGIHPLSLPTSFALRSRATRIQVHPSYGRPRPWVCGTWKPTNTREISS